MFESRSKVTELKCTDASKVYENCKKESVDVAIRYPITEAFIRLLNCELSNEFVPKTYADLIDFAYYRRAFKFCGAREFREILNVVEGASRPSNLRLLGRHGEVE